MDIFEQDAEVAQAEMETSSTAITEDLEAMWQQEVRALSDRKRELSESEAHLADGTPLVELIEDRRSGERSGSWRWIAGLALRCSWYVG